MNDEGVMQALDEARSKSKKRNFKQGVDFIVSLKGLDLKKPEQQLSFFVDMPNAVGRRRKVCAFVGAEALEDAKKNCDTVVFIDDFPKYGSDKKLAKKLALSHDYFIAQANIMPKVAATFGKVLGTKGKMPNPKAGCVFPPKAALEPLVRKLQAVAAVSAKTQSIVQIKVGEEDMDNAKLTANILAVYHQIEHHVPDAHNIKGAFVKLTMGPSVKVK